MKSLIAGGLIVLSLATAAQAQTFVYESTRHVPDARVDSLVQSATRKCDPSGRVDYRSAQFNQCMLRLGWKFTNTRPLQRQYQAHRSNHPSRVAPPDTSWVDIQNMINNQNMVNNQAANHAAAAAAQDQFNAGMAASQLYMNQNF
jgi:hypothetical protein